MEDPDSLSPKPFAHWLVANISPNMKGLPANLPMYEKVRGMSFLQGSNHTSKSGYFGPKPPADVKVHHYNFQVFALNSRLKLPSGYNRQALVDAMRGKVLAKGKLLGGWKRDPY